MTPKPIHVTNNQDDIDPIPIDIEAFALDLAHHLGMSIVVIDITLLDSPTIRDMNARFFNNDVTTDTITFNLESPESIVGDIYLCPHTIQANAHAYNTDIATEFKRVIIHSFLHLLGHRDTTADEFESMKAYEDQLLDQLSS
jgi:probable rRNA maturation factor